MSKRKYIAYFMCLVFSDIAAYFAAAFSAYGLRMAADHILAVQVPLKFSYMHLLSFWWIPASMVLFFILSGVYYKKEPLWMESGKLIKGIFTAFIFSMALVSLGHLSGDISRLFMCLLFFLLPFFVILFRMAVKNLLFRFPYFMQKAVLMGDGEELEKLKRCVEDENFMGIRICECVAVDSRNDFPKIDTALAKGYDLAVVSPFHKVDEDIQEIYNNIQRKVYSFMIIPGHTFINISNSVPGQILKHQTAYISISNALKSPFNRILKRTFDIVAALCVMPVVIPVTAICAVLIKLTSKGPVIFAHERVGREGRKFPMYKLRTMYEDAEERLAGILESDPKMKKEWLQHYKLKNDPRITKVGKFLRVTSLDEFPQFFNVLFGSMSFIGPRPMSEAQLELHYGENKVYYQMVRPGITGLWQISGRSDKTYQERISLDCWYIFNWSLWLDIVILFCTPKAVVFQSGAY